jgi:hypothetical protein
MVAGQHGAWQGAGETGDGTSLWHWPEGRWFAQPSLLIPLLAGLAAPAGTWNRGLWPPAPGQYGGGSGLCTFLGFRLPPPRPLPTPPLSPQEQGMFNSPQPH